MKIAVRFFASLRDAAGTAAIDVQLPEGARFETLLQALEGQLAPGALPALLADNVRLARNQDLITPPFALADGDEIAFLPPVTGG
ncbi:MAG: MoaD/ThiS family protein [Pseudomonadales bacterium]